MSIAVEIRQEAHAKESARRQRGTENYRAMVRTTAAGTKRPSLEEIERAARDAGKTISDFTADVERQERRIAAAARLKQIPAQREKLDEVRQAIEGHEATLQEAYDRHARATEGLFAQANQLTNEIDQADALKLQLISTAEPETIAAIDAAAEEHLQADTAVRQARQEIETGNGSKERLEKHRDSPGFDTQHHEQLIAAAKAAEAALPQLQQDLADAESRAAQARQRLLEP